MPADADLVWPNAESAANSDPWLIANHDRIRLMRPRVLAVNFVHGLSEREASELVARTLLTHWGIQQTGPVQVDRVSGAPYAVAYVDGILRINPAFLYLAAASGLASTPANVQ